MGGEEDTGSNNNFLERKNAGSNDNYHRERCWR